MSRDLRELKKSAVRLPGDWGAAGAKPRSRSGLGVLPKQPGGQRGVNGLGSGAERTVRG